MPDKTNRHFHFIVRSSKEEYDYSPGYGYVLNHVVEQLNEEKPKTAHELLTSAVSLMFNPEGKIEEPIWKLTSMPKRNMQKLKDGIPPAYKAIAEDAVPPRGTYGRGEQFFGPVNSHEFGMPMSSTINISNVKGENFGMYTLDFQARQLCEFLESEKLTDAQRQQACDALNKVLGRYMGEAITPAMLVSAPGEVAAVREAGQAVEMIKKAVSAKYGDDDDDDGFSTYRKKAVPWQDKWKGFSRAMAHVPEDVVAADHPLRGYESPQVVMHGDVLFTPIVSFEIGDKPSAYRGYLDALCKNQGLDANALPAEFKKQFEYPVPGSDEMLKLITVGTRQALKDEHGARFNSEFPEVHHHEKVARFAGDYWILTKPDEMMEESDVGKRFGFGPDYRRNIVFVHADADVEFMGRLEKCIDPLLAKIDSKDKTLEQKEDAMAETYWLVSQATPVWRGGSAYARVLLEHMAERIQEQGIDYTIPYTKPDVDLWAEAVTSSLSHFKEMFASKELFDEKVTDKQMEDYARARIKPGLLASAGSSIPKGGTFQL